MKCHLMVLIILLCMSGCSEKEIKPEPVQTLNVSPGAPAHYDIGDVTLRNKLPDDVLDGFLGLSKAPGFSYGVLMAHDKITARSHERSDMLVYIHSGITRFHVGEKSFWAAAGDVVYIPRGAVYSVTAKEQYPLEFLVVYSPPFNADDVEYHEKDEG